MPRPTKKIEIPLHDLKGIYTLLNEGKTYAEIGEYFGVSRFTIVRRLDNDKL